MLRLVVSADSHVMEPLDLWTSHLPAHLRAKGPRLELREEGACLMVEDTVVRRFSGRSDGGTSDDTTAAARERAAKTFAPETSDPDRRLRDLDADGVCAARRSSTIFRFDAETSRRSLGSRARS